jgi:type I restriction enzyme M protein
MVNGTRRNTQGTRKSYARIWVSSLTTRFVGIPNFIELQFKEDISAYIKREVLPYAPDAWVDESKTKKGYEIPFTRHFYKYTELGNAEDTLRDIQSLGMKIQSAIAELFGEV